MWDGININEFLKILQSNECEDIKSEYGFSEESIILTFKNNLRIRITSVDFRGYSALNIEQEIKNRGDSIR